MTLSSNMKIVFAIGTVLILLVPGIIGYFLNGRISIVPEFAIGIYGIYSLVYFILQVIFSQINKKRIQNSVKERNPEWANLGVGVIIVGYREEPNLLRRCLETIRDSEYSNIQRVIFVIDGNESTDVYMSSIYKEVFKNENVVKLNKLLCDTDFPNLGSGISHITDGTQEDIDFSKRFMCIMQPHGGKREGLYTGFKILTQDPSVDVVITTDSDTMLDKFAIKEMAYQCIQEEIGAVAGQINIWNTSDSLLSNIVSCRYWMSFNLERACQSYWKTVMCVAGPMACYKSSVLKDIMDEWYNQTFFGEKCTFGDDRHLTNRVLLKGKKVIYTEYAKGYTDTPSNWFQYLRQQTRWSKSYFREFLFNMQSVHLHPVWMCYELLYNILYFFVILYWIVYILYFGSVLQQSIAVLVTFGISIIKCIYAITQTGDFRFLFYHLYSFIYFLVIIPSKISAIFTLWDTHWGTRGKTSSFILTYFGSIVWISTLIGGFSYTIYKNHQFDNNDYKYMFAFISWMSYLSVVIISVIVNFICRKMKKNKYYSSDIVDTSFEMQETSV